MPPPLRRGLSAGLAAVAGWRFFKPAAFLACAWPGVGLAWRTWRFFGEEDVAALGVNPTETLLHETGKTALLMLLLALTVTPVRRLFKVDALQRVRRMLGLWSFTYAVIHLSVYLVFDQLCYSIATCDLLATWNDILKRRFIFAGQLAFVILLLLAITSTSAWVRRLKRNWQRLHRLVYVAATAAIVHFVWIQKSDYGEPLRWAAWLALLFAVRAGFAIAKRRAPARGTPAATSASA